MTDQPIKITEDILALLKLRVTYRDMGRREQQILDAVRSLRDNAADLLGALGDFDWQGSESSLDPAVLAIKLAMDRLREQLP